MHYYIFNSSSLGIYFVRKNWDGWFRRAWGLRIRAVTTVQGLEYFVNLDKGMSFRLDSFYPITEVFVEDEKRIYAHRLGHWYEDSEIQIKF